MNLNQRVALLEAKARESRDSDGGVLLSPYDVAVLLIEKAECDDSPESVELVSRIDALLESHRRGAARSRLEPMTPAEASAAAWEAAEREEDPEAAETYRQERMAKLLAC